MLGCLALLFFRLACLGGYGYSAYMTILAFGSPSKTPAENALFHTRYLTQDTLVAQIIYFALVILLMPMRFNKCKGALAAFALTTTTVVSALFWAIYFQDKHMIGNEEMMKAYPPWLMHVEVISYLLCMTHFLLAHPCDRNCSSGCHVFSSITSSILQVLVPHCRILWRIPRIVSFFGG